MCYKRGFGGAGLWVYKRNSKQLMCLKNNIMDPHNPAIITDSELVLPSWLCVDTHMPLNTLPKYNKNWDIHDRVLNYQASFYGAEYWYDELVPVTSRSRLIHLSEEDITALLGEEERYLTDQLQVELQSCLDNGLHFVKSSKKSSHSKKAVYTLTDCEEQICDYADVLMSFKKGCRYLFMREYLNNIEHEFRCIVHGGIVTYIEQYDREPLSGTPDIDPILAFMNTEVLPRTHYRDATFDLARLSDGTYTVIEVNTPPYLFAGLTLLSVDRERDALYGHSPADVIFRHY